MVKVSSYRLKGLLVVVMSVLSLGLGVSSTCYLADKYAYVSVLSPTRNSGIAPSTRASVSARDNRSREGYCTAGNLLGHYYANYYSGDSDSREFFYFQRDWLSVCGR